MTLEEFARTELKSCPFCGGNAVVHCINNKGYCKVRVGCPKCGCVITGTADIKDTIKKWNTRKESEDNEHRKKLSNLQIL